MGSKVAANQGYDAVKIDKPGVYDISADEYHADPCPEPSLSCSVAKLLINSTPLHAWTAHPRLNPGFEAEADEKFDLGSAAHSLILHDPKIFAVIDAADWRTKDAKAKRDAAREAGKIPLLTEQWIRVEAMARSALIQLSRHEEAAGAFRDGVPEQTLVWQEGDVWCRARLDWRPNTGDIFDDYKSTAALADPDAFSRILFNIGHDVQAAFYRRGIRALGLSRNPVFRFIVQELDTPHALSVIALMPSALDLADHKVARAIDIWRECLGADEWPGYPSRTCYVEAPLWHEQQFMARDARYHEMRRASGEELRAGTDSQAPL